MKKIEFQPMPIGRYCHWIPFDDEQIQWIINFLEEHEWSIEWSDEDENIFNSILVAFKEKDNYE